MVRAIDLDRQPCTLAVEVEDELADGMLPPELHPQLGAAQRLPESALRQ